MRRKIYLVITCVCAVVFIVSVTMLGISLQRYHKADTVYSNLQGHYVFLNPPAPEETPEEGTREIITAPISVDFDALLQENADIVGWLYCENTEINYPVVQAADNNYYLRRDLYGDYLISGTLFVDYRCPTVGTGQNFIIYGHNMNNGTMFGTMVEYKEQAYADAHPVLWYLTPDRDYRIELFAGQVTASDSEVYTPSFGSAERFEEFLRDIKDHSTFVSDLSVTGEDHIITLSTCSYEFGNARYVVFGKLISLAEQQ